MYLTVIPGAAVVAPIRKDNDMTQLTNLAVQTVEPNENVLFGTVIIHSRSGAERFLLGGGQLVLLKPGVYDVDFTGNIAVPTGETVGEISLSFTLDGELLPGSRMRVTPAAVEEYFNVAKSYLVTVPCNCCARLAVRNTSDIPVLVDSPVLHDVRNS